MPELPEVEVTRLGLLRKLKNKNVPEPLSEKRAFGSLLSEQT